MVLRWLEADLPLTRNTERSSMISEEACGGGFCLASEQAFTGQCGQDYSAALSVHAISLTDLPRAANWRCLDTWDDYLESSETVHGFSR